MTDEAGGAVWSEGALALCPSEDGATSRPRSFG